jgi:hypothetical protein
LILLSIEVALTLDSCSRHHRVVQPVELGGKLSRLAAVDELRRRVIAATRQR